MAGTFKYRRTYSPNNNKKSSKETPPIGTPLLAYRDILPDPQKTLLGSRFLCVEGAALLIGPSGIGKSSNSIQKAILWSIGRSAFNIDPTRPLKISIIQAEDDEGDVHEMVTGAVAHFDLNPSEILLSEQNCCIYFHKDLTADKFLSDVVKPILIQDRPDLLIINPLQAYLGADVKDTEKVSKFLRNGLNPLLEKYQCAVLVVHHTPKTNFRNTEKWRASDWLYGGAGCADISNWARAIIIIEPTDVDKVFRFIAAKRGARLGWTKDEQGYSQHFAWADGSIFWRDATADEIKKAKRKKPDKGPDEVLALVPQTGLMEKNELMERANLELGMGERKYRPCINTLIREGRLFEHKEPRTTGRPKILVSRFAPTPGSPFLEP